MENPEPEQNNEPEVNAAENTDFNEELFKQKSEEAGLSQLVNGSQGISLVNIGDKDLFNAETKYDPDIVKSLKEFAVRYNLSFLYDPNKAARNILKKGARSQEEILQEFSNARVAAKEINQTLEEYVTQQEKFRDVYVMSKNGKTKIRAEIQDIDQQMKKETDLAKKKLLRDKRFAKERLLEEIVLTYNLAAKRIAKVGKEIEKYRAAYETVNYITLSLADIAEDDSSRVQKPENVVVRLLGLAEGINQKMKKYTPLKQQLTEIETAYDKKLVGAIEGLCGTANTLKTAKTANQAYGHPLDQVAALNKRNDREFSDVEAYLVGFDSDPYAKWSDVAIAKK